MYFPGNENRSCIPLKTERAQVQFDCLFVEAPLDSKMDRETTTMAENILGNKIPVHGTKLEVLLRAYEATAISGTAPNSNKRISEQKFNTLIEMLSSKGDMKILISPRIQVVDGQMAIVKSDLGSIQITPHVLGDSHISLDIEADISKQTVSEGKEQTPIISKHEIYTRRFYINSGESLIIGRMKKKEVTVIYGAQILKDMSLIGILFSNEDTEQRTVENIFMLIPTIVSKTDKPENKTNVQVDTKDPGIL